MLVVVSFAVLVFVLVLFLFFKGVAVCRLGQAGDFDVVGAAPAAIEMPREAAAATVEAKRAAAAIAVVPATYFQPAVQFLGNGEGDAPGVNIDNAADGARAVQQSGRSLVDADLFDQERIHRHHVVAAGGGDVHGVDVVFHDANPGTFQPMNDGPAHGGAERR